MTALGLGATSRPRPKWAVTVGGGSKTAIIRRVSSGRIYPLGAVPHAKRFKLTARSPRLRTVGSIFFTSQVCSSARVSGRGLMSVSREEGYAQRAAPPCVQAG